MSESLGGLFAKLGFEVDDTQLKKFDDGIQSAFNNILKLAGVSLSIAGMTVIAKDASDAALQVRNLGTDFNTSAKAAQGFAAALHQFNPLVSTAQGLQSYKGLEKYIQNIRTTGGSATAYNMLGGYFDDNTTPEVMIDTVRKNLPKVIAEHGTAFASKWVNDLFGDVGAMNALTQSLENFQQAADKGIVTPEALANMVKMRENIAGLVDEWDKFWGNIMGKLSPYLTAPLKEINDKGVQGALGSWTEKMNERGRVRHIIGWNATDDEVDAYIAKTKPAQTSGSVMSQITGMGWSPAQAAGMAQRLMLESGMNPAAIGDSGQAYGIAQWHPDRQANFKAWSGHDIHGTSVEEQLQFMNYELTRGLEQKAGQHLKQTQNADEAYNSFTNNYERPAVTQNNEIHVHSTGNPQEVAEEVQRRIAERFSYAYAQQNLGSNY